MTYTVGVVEIVRVSPLLILLTGMERGYLGRTIGDIGSGTTNSTRDGGVWTTEQRRMLKTGEV